MPSLPRKMFTGFFLIIIIILLCWVSIAVQVFLLVETQGSSLVVECRLISFVIYLVQSVASRDLDLQ